MSRYSNKDWPVVLLKKMLQLRHINVAHYLLNSTQHTLNCKYFFLDPVHLHSITPKIITNIALIISWLTFDSLPVSSIVRTLSDMLALETVWRLSKYVWWFAELTQSFPSEADYMIPCFRFCSGLVLLHVGVADPSTTPWTRFEDW